MTRRGLRADATASTRATVYQLCVAVARCFALKPGQKLLIESLGDLTIEDDIQVEVKHYNSVPLTDGSENFWNTLYNWMDAKFPQEKYASLILFTTQQFGARARLRDWNGADAENRLGLLKSIHAEFTEAFEATHAENDEAQRSKVLRIQDWILDPARSILLEQVLPKAYIEASAPSLSDLYQTIQTERLHGIPAENKSAFMDALLGFVCCANEQNWEIGHDEFDDKFGELYAIHGRATRMFPAKPRADYAPQSLPATEDADPFVQKILDIEYEDVIHEAIHDYQNAMDLIEQRIMSYLIDPRRWKEYHSEVIGLFNVNYRRASRNFRDEVSCSQDFYDDVHKSGAPTFPGFQNSPIWFRNGLLHVEMNTSEMRWKLQKRRST